MLRWPVRAKAALQKLFEPLQDLDVYVEDENDEVFYNTLLQRLCSEKLRITRVFGLGGREVVLKRARQYNNLGRKALFLIDGDLSWIRGKAEHGPSFLHQLDAYCVENFLVCEDALALVLSQDAVLDMDEAKNKLAFTAWEAEVSDLLIDLFAAYATLQEFSPHHKTVSKGVGNFCTANRKGRGASLSREKVIREIDGALGKAIAATDEATALRFYEAIRKKILDLPRPLDAISAKDFLLPLLLFRMQDLGCRPTRKSLRLRLAASCKVARLDQLKRALELTARGA